MDESKALELLGPAFDRLKELAKYYKLLGYAGFMAIVGAIVIISTAIIAFQTDPSVPGSGFLNVDRYEETLFILSGIFLMVFGGAAYGLRIILQHRSASLETQLQIAKLQAIGDIGRPSNKLDKG